MISSPKIVLFVGVLISFFSSCITAEKYNQKRENPISVKKLQKDIDYVQNNLYSRHPDFDYYTPKKDLDYKFDSLRKAINKPMTAHQFYPVIAQVIASVHQGHMAVIPAPRKINRERKKYLKSMGASPFSQFDYMWENEKLIVLKNKSDDSSIKKGCEMIAINGLAVKDIYKKYYKTLTSDGYNQTALPSFFTRRIPTFYNEELGSLDSLIYTFSIDGNQIDKVIYRKTKESKKDSVTAKNVDSVVQNISKDSALAKANIEKSAAKEKQKIEDRQRGTHGYDKNKKELTRSLKFYGKDSAIARLNILQFANGTLKKSYAQLFDSIQKTKSKVLILDLRDNPGGRAKEIVELYRYFADSSFKMYAPSKVSSKTALFNAGLYKKVPKGAWPFLSLYYPFYAAHSFFNIKKQGNAYYYHGMVGHKWKIPHKNAFKGKIYVLINGGSFSAACLLASRMAVLPNVTFVGEETGGDFNGTVAGQMPMLNLPNSNIIWRMGLIHIRPVNRTETHGRGIFPNQTFTSTASDLIQDKDAALDWILAQNQ